MLNHQSNTAYDNITQRSVSTYLKYLADYQLLSTQNESEETKEQNDLRSFFQTFYTIIYNHAESFGLPTTPDEYIAENEPDEKAKKQEVKRALDRPKRLISAGLDFLMQAGIQGRLENNVLRLDHSLTSPFESRSGKKFLAGMTATGLEISTDKNGILLTNSRFSKMMPALKIIAVSCAAYQHEQIGRFMFSICDFRSSTGYQPQAVDLFRAFDGADYQRIIDLHAYFTSKNYNIEIGIQAPYAWTVKYQGNRKIKSTPLFEVDYGDRYLYPLRMQIKCVSTARLVDILPRQSKMLQEDFSHRVFICREDECGWCRNQKTLGPSIYEYQGESKKVCWFSNSDIRVSNENTVDLIKEYEQMHAGLPV